MFRVKDSEIAASSCWPERIVRIGMLLALAVNFVAAGLVFHEYWQLGHWPGGSDSYTALQGEFRLQFILTLLVATIQAFCLAAFWWFFRQYSASRQSLRQVKILAHDILASMDQGVVTTNRHGAVSSINSAAIQLLGVNFECVGQPIGSLASTDFPLEALTHEVAGRNGPVQDRRFTINRAGRVQRVHADAHVLKDTLGKYLGYVIHLRDVTERTLMEERMWRMERFISLGALASGLHHEIKNPLTALSIHIQLLEERLSDPASTEPVEELVGVLRSEVVRMNGVLESFRSFANLQRLCIQPTDALELLHNTARLVRPQAAQQKVEIALQTPKQKCPPVPMDPDKFEQALLNLVINGLEAMPAGGRLTLKASIEDSVFRVEVIDTGPGIPAEVQPSLFEPYFSTKDKGTGMGLALSEKLIGQHGGRIDYHTGKEGTTFRISIPLEATNGTP